MTTRTEATEISVGMKNSLRALLGLQRSTEEQDRYFHAKRYLCSKTQPPLHMEQSNVGKKRPSCKRSGNTRIS